MRGNLCYCPVREWARIDTNGVDFIRDIEALGRAVRSKRRTLGLTQADLAGVCGVGARFISELERGKATAEIGKVFQVLQRLGLDVWLGQRGSRASSRR